MTARNSVSGNYVKKETMLIGVFIALIVGFLGGIVFNIYQSGTRVPTQSPISQDTSEKYSQRLADLKTETSKHPQDAEAWIQMGNIYFDNDRYSEAIDAYGKALAINPNNADVRTDLGVMYRRSGRPEKAIEQFNLAVKIDPHHETALFDKGIVLLHDLNDPKGAIQAWEKVVEINPFAKAPNGQPLVELIDKVKQTESH